MSNPEKKKRNNRIVDMFKRGVSKRGIARMENLHHTTVMEILEHRGYPVGVTQKKRA